MFRLLSTLPAALYLLHGVVAGPPIVSLNYGVFQGATDGNLSTFLGVPFAQPAVRFALPKPSSALQGVQNATAFGPACPQQALSPIPFPLPFNLSHPSVSEDCLTVNVFAPRSAKQNSKLPVFVWIYGGGFEIGTSADQDVRGIVERSITIREPVIIVTPNYRLNAFGFLAGKEVSQAGITNLGLRDQIFALEWVQKHIAAFGGDPKRVVIGGPSAGGISVGLLLLNNKRFEQKDLFHGAFMLSGSPITTSTVVEGQSNYNGLVEANNCTESADTLDCLRRVPFDAFMATVNNTANIFSDTSVRTVWRPRVDGDVVVYNPLVVFSVPIISGDSDDEGTVNALSNSNITTNDEFVNYLHSNFHPEATSSQMTELAKLYPDDPVQGSPFGTGLANQFTPEFKRLAAFQGDYLLIGARRFFLEHASKTQNSWSWLNKKYKSTPFLGSYHTSDIPIFFPSANSTFYVRVDALVKFVNYLDPNGRSPNASKHTSLIFWPKWNALSADGPTSLLTFNDPDTVNVTAENFRIEPIRYLFDLLLFEG